MRIDIITLFPEMFAPLFTSIPAQAQKKGLLELRLIDLRSCGSGRHYQTDDVPYGGGCGMVMQPGPLSRAIGLASSGSEKPPHVVFMSPQGKTFNQKKAEELAALPHLVMICGHYEGIDERIIQRYVHEEISAGDFVLSGGELASMLIADAVVRLIPGVIDAQSAAEESFSSGLLDYPHYTRPEVFEGMAVPPALLSGDHKRIALWRHRQALLATARKRPELLSGYPLSQEDKRILSEEGFDVP